MTAPVATRTLDHCLACGGTELRPLALAYEYAGTRFPACSCATCGMRFLQVQPTATTLARMYGAEYFESDFRCGRSDARASDELAFRAENDGLLDRFERYRGRGRLLDVGCANGLLVKRACERAWAAQGVELSAEAVARARALGVQVREGTLRDAAFPDASFDLVYTGDVLEHVPDCREVAAEVARVLAPGGHWFLRGPITTHSLARSLALAVAGRAGRAIVLREPPYHLWEFTPGPLAALMRRVGLEVVAVEQAKIAPGAAHGQKSALQRAALFVLDSVNLPLTRLLNARGDRVVLVARRP